MGRSTQGIRKGVQYYQGLVLGNKRDHLVGSVQRECHGDLTASQSLC